MEWRIPKVQIETQHQSNNRHISKPSASVTAYQVGTHKIQERASQQGLAPEKFLDNTAQKKAEESLISTQARVDREHIEILDGGANQKNKVGGEQSRNRHGGLANDLIHDIDTKDHQKERA